ncbi:MAG: DMT family transporter [Paracoccaceae bacterium]
MTSNLAGALLMMASMACFTLNDALLKATNGDLPLFQLLFLRGIFAMFFIAVLAGGRRANFCSVAGRDWMLISLRSVSEIGAAYFFVTALLKMPLANVTAILQILPLTVTLGSALFFREAVGWRRMLAIGIGFCGMLMIVRPGTDGFNIWSIYALAAVACVTARDLVTRRMSPSVPSLLVTLSASAAVLIAFGAASLSIEWMPVSFELGSLVVASSVFIVGGYHFSVQVMRQGDVSFIAPFRYTGLIWALVLGWFVFGDWPSALTVLGAGIIVATGLFALYRERHHFRK